HYRQERYDAAFADLRRALECGANAAEAHFNLALVHRARGDRAAALASVEQALQAAPQHADALALREALRRARSRFRQKSPPSRPLRSGRLVPAKGPVPHGLTYTTSETLPCAPAPGLAKAHPDRV